MYSFEITGRFLTVDEKSMFGEFLRHYGIDEGVWEVFSCLFRSRVKGTVPLVLRIYENSDLAGAAIIIKCSRYGRSLYNNNLIAGLFDLLGIPFYIWIRFGCCMDMMSNPGFVRDPQKSDIIYAAMAQYLGNHSLMTIINDYTENSYLYPGATKLPALPHAVIDTTGMTSLNDYLNLHKNIKRKSNIFKNNGGTFNLVSNVLEVDDLDFVRRCFLSTAEKSVFYLPYEDLYLNSAITTSSTSINNVIYFIARLNGVFIGYQAALKTGNYLNALHGAFDRERSTTYHAYALLFVEMTRFAIENRLKLIDVGAVLNITKQRMVNHTRLMSYFLLSKNKVIRWIFYMIAKNSKIQGQQQMRFYEEDLIERAKHDLPADRRDAFKVNYFL